ncbi:kinesin [Novymonas esmeraldas]|uniref:Kinesin n=1 Tax=Novymonas esmeraldas TaxID=1808958 RepID=A0AAW0EJZ8_9TRYP
MAGTPPPPPLPMPAGSAAVINEGVGVVVRVRPLSTKERADPGVHNCIQCLPDCVVIDGSAHARSSTHAGAGTAAAAAAATAGPASQPTRATTRPYQFSVDQVFHTHASQIEVYEQSCKRIVEGVFHGINGSILAYGATGSGKTHTMFGSTMSAAGIVYQAVQDIFAEKERLEEEAGKRVRIKCSFLEVYNEDVFDLLAKPTAAAKRVPLQVREVSGAAAAAAAAAAASAEAEERHAAHNAGLHIHGLTHIFPETLEDFARGVEHGHAQRFVAATGANAQSSRSHAIITVEVEVRDADTDADTDAAAAAAAAADADDAAETSPSKKAAKKKKKQKIATPTVTVAKVQFADLAGSERAAATSNTGVRLREGGNINRSLLALGAVVQCLAQQKVRRRQTGGTGGGKIFVPYRGSKLTRLLRDGIGGNCRTQMLFCLSPSTKHTEETVNTMKFAMNAKEIQVEAHRNEFAVNSSQLAKSQEAVIEELREELARARSALAAYTSVSADEQERHSSSINGDGGGAPSADATAEAAAAAARAARASESPSLSLSLRAGQGSSPTTLSSPSLTVSSADRGRSSPAPTPTAPAMPPRGSKSVQRGTMTPSAAAAAPGAAPSPPANASRSSAASQSVTDASPAGGSMPRPSVSSRTARPSVFAESTPLFSELEAKLKDFSAQKESLYHEVRDAQERERDGETQLREYQWRLATFLVSTTSGSRARGETDDPRSTAVGVAGLRKMISDMEAVQSRQAAQLSTLTARLDDADRQFDATRQELLRERQGTSLELLLDNARLRQGCTEAECLAAHYHQECRSLLHREAEYAEALSKCVGAIQRLRPHHAQLTSLAASAARGGGTGGNAVAAAVEAANVALLYALLPTTSTSQMMTVFEAALRSTVTTPPLAPVPLSVAALSPSPPPALSFAHPPLAPSPVHGSGGSGSRSPMRGGGSASDRGPSHLAEHFRDLMAAAESMHLTSSGERDAGEGGDGTRVRHGLQPSLSMGSGGTSSSSPERRASAPGTNKGVKSRARAPPAGVAKSFGRTVSLTGLTRSTAAGHGVATAGAGAAGGGGAAAKRGPGGASRSARPLQRSVSAPSPFSRSASYTNGTAVAAPRRQGNGAGGAPSSSAADRPPKKPAFSSPRTAHASPYTSTAFVRSNTAAALRANAGAAGDGLSGRGPQRGGGATSATAVGTAQPPSSSTIKKKQGGSARNTFTTVNTTSSSPGTAAAGTAARTHASRGKRLKQPPLAPNAGVVGKVTHDVAASGDPLQRRLDYAGAMATTPTATASLSRISSTSSSDLSMSGVSAPSRGVSVVEGMHSYPAGGGADHAATPALTVARLMERAAAAASPGPPQSSTIVSPYTHSSGGGGGGGGGSLKARDQQQSQQPRRRTSAVDDLTVSRSTCLSELQTPTSRGQVSSSYY